MATVITNVTELQAMENDLTADYELGNDIDALATSGWNGGLGFDPVGDWDTPFTGSFDGKGYIIIGLYINRPEEAYIGLFGRAEGATALQNVGLIDVNITGLDDTGALCGAQDGGDLTISNCYSAGQINGSDIDIGGLIGSCYGDVEHCHSSCVVTLGISIYFWESGQFGGLLGSARKAVTHCYATGDVTVVNDTDVASVGGLVGYSSGGLISKCYATGDVSVTATERAQWVGGFAGTTEEDVSDCYARGAVSVTVGDTEYGDIGGFVGLVDDVDADIDNCYSTGAVTTTEGMPDIGGFCGDNYGDISNCFWDKLTSGMVDSDGGTGKTTSQMKTKATFTDADWVFYGDFDVESPIWHITDGLNNGYPMLPAQGFGHYWIEDDYWCFVGELGKQRILGADTGDNGVAGYYFIEGDAWHYIDESGNERSQSGFETVASGEGGYFWIDDLRWRIVDSSGNEEELGMCVLDYGSLDVDAILY